MSTGDEADFSTLRSDLNGRNKLQVILHNADKLGIDYDRLPPLPFWAGLAGYSRTWYKLNVAGSIINMSTAVGRPLTYDETQALAGYWGAYCRHRTYEPLTALGLTAFLWNRGRAKFRFPFHTPGPDFSPHMFPGIPGLAGQRAFVMLHVVRALAYGIPTWYVTQAVVGSYAKTSAMVKITMDPILKELNAAIMKEAREHAGPRGRRAPPAPVDPAHSAPPTPPSAEGAWQQDQDQGWQNGTSSPFLDEQDDRSGVSSMETQQTSFQSPTGGSAWDRLRRKSAEGSGSDAPRQEPQAGGYQDWAERRRGSQQTGGAGQGSDSYTYSEQDQDNAVAKEQAQKEFDAMLERERRGQGKDY